MKRILTLLLTLSMILSLTACGGNTPPAGDGLQGQAQSSQESQETSQESQTSPDAQASEPAGETPDTEAASDAQPSLGESEAEAFPVTLTDQLGREVVISQAPQTLVSGYYISTSLLIALGLTDRLAGVEAKADSRSIYRLSAPSLLELPSVGTAKEFDLEGCAALAPDLVILPAKLESVIPSLEELGIPVLAVNPEDKDLLEEAVVLLGAATGTSSRARELLAFHDEQLAPLSEALSGCEQPAVYLASNSSLLAGAGAGMYQDSLIREAGGVNAAESLEADYWGDISYEQLLAWDPEYIILAADASYTVQSVLEDENLQSCRAVTQGHVYQFPNAIEAWDSPVPSSILGSMWLASILHPDAYPEELWKDAARTYYETFYGFTPDLENLYEEAE